MDDYTIRKVVSCIFLQVAEILQHSECPQRNAYDHLRRLWEGVTFEYSSQPRLQRGSIARTAVFRVAGSSDGTALDRAYITAGFERRCAINFNGFSGDALHARIFVALLRGVDSAMIREVLIDSHPPRTPLACSAP